MCGIVGYIGSRDAYPVLLKGLSRLEYRGYDSAGVALLNAGGGLNVYKAKGKVADLDAFCHGKDVSGTVLHIPDGPHMENLRRSTHIHIIQSLKISL